MGRFRISRWLVCFLALAIFAVTSARPAFAGQNEAGIIGQVTDESGAVLPGVTVTATSPALQLPQVTGITNERGEYRLSPLPVGSYSVEYALSGFQSLRRDGLRLTVGFTAKLDIVLKVGTLAETVTVSGAAPVVDTASTSSATQLVKEALELIPTSRNGYSGLLNQAPGTRGVIDVGGENFNSNPTFHAFGMDGESWQSLEGVVTTSAKASQTGNYSDYSSYEEAKIQTFGNDAEIRPAAWRSTPWRSRAATNFTAARLRHTRTRGCRRATSTRRSSRRASPRATSCGIAATGASRSAGPSSRTRSGSGGTSGIGEALRTSWRASSRMAPRARTFRRKGFSRSRARSRSTQRTRSSASGSSTRSTTTAARAA